MAFPLLLAALWHSPLGARGGADVCAGGPGECSAVPSWRGASYLQRGAFSSEQVHAEDFLPPGAARLHDGPEDAPEVSAATEGGRAGANPESTSGGGVPDSDEVSEERGPRFSYNFSKRFLLVVPKRKFMFCYIPKNGCSQFNRLANMLNGFTAPADLSHPWFRSSALDQFGWTHEELERAMGDKSWFKGVFLRNPLDRLLSAFLSKCNPREDGTVEDAGKHCLNFVEKVQGRRHPTFVEFIQGLGQSTHLEKGIQNAHFRPQKDLCGGIDLEKYHYVGSFAHDLNGQVTDMLRMAGFDSREVSFVDKFFHQGNSGTVASNRVTHASSPKLRNSWFHNLETMSLAYEIYRPDFSMLASVAPPPRDRICITSAVALDFEKFRILDWIAYHNLIGVNCFILFLDLQRSSMEDPDAALVHEKLLSSKQVVLFEIADTKERIPEPRKMKNILGAAHARFLAPLDADELIVIQPGGEVPEAPRALPDLRKLLREMLQVQPDAVGMYLHRLSFGTSGYIHPPISYDGSGFGMFTERSQIITHYGKPILDMHSGVEYIGVHTWGLAARAGQQSMMLLPNGTEFRCKNTCLCPRMEINFPGMECSDVDSCVREDCTPSHAHMQPIAINHYVTGSLAECLMKLSRNQWTRRTQEECETFHEAQGFKQDRTLLPHSRAIRVRRNKIFGEVLFQFENSTSRTNLAMMGFMEPVEDRAQSMLLVEVAETLTAI